MPNRLGPLETQMLRLVWERGQATVRELIDSREVSGAYTTVMTTVDRLYKKGLLDRVSEGRAFRYSPRKTRDEFKGAMIHRALDSSHGPRMHRTARAMMPAQRPSIHFEK